MYTPEWEKKCDGTFPICTSVLNNDVSLICFSIPEVPVTGGNRRQLDTPGMKWALSKSETSWRGSCLLDESYLQMEPNNTIVLMPMLFSCSSWITATWLSSCLITGQTGQVHITGIKSLSGYGNCFFLNSCSRVRIISWYLGRSQNLRVGGGGCTLFR